MSDAPRATSGLTARHLDPDENIIGGALRERVPTSGAFPFAQTFPARR